ncbi:MAG: hypothetical protein M1837_002681 [Sclerophora amabilis]|nr:MAG: hypothetical protein M1837_002681 [Sclerophora amabilis]
MSLYARELFDWSPSENAPESYLPSEGSRYAVVNVVTLGGLIAFSLLGITIYRLVLHPLARYPGPKLAAATVMYEFYYDAIKGGMYVFEIQRMHEKYGPIVRISPNELHVNEPSFIDELYAGGGKARDKYDYATAQFGIPDSVFGAVSHNLHRMRRGALNPFFSKASVTKLEPIIHEKIEKLCRQLKTYEGSGSPVDLTMAFSCMTTDVVTEYAFAKCSNFLDSPTFEPNFHSAIIAGSNMGPFTKPFPWIFPLLRALPDSFVMRLVPDMGYFVQWQRDMRKQVASVQKEVQQKPKQATRPAHATIFHELFEGNLPDSEKRPERMWQEGQIVIGAGTETTAWTLTVTMFYVLNNPSILSSLQQELQVAIPEPSERVACKTLDNLPYLIMPSYLKGSASPMAYDIPRGTPVGMTSTLVHLNPSLFPQPLEFRPERWLDADNKRDKTLDKYLLSFSKGSRQCIGINLAYAELYMTLGFIIRRIGSQLNLYETDKSDVEIESDQFVAMPKASSKGVRVTISPGNEGP